MTKRVCESRLTREQLEAGDEGSDDGPDTRGNEGGAGTADASVLAARKIVKVKRHVQQTGEVKTEVPSKPAQFKLAGSLSAGVQAAASGSAVKPSFTFAAAPATNNA